MRGIRFPVGAAACLLCASLAHALPLAFVTNEGSNSVSIVDLASSTVVATVVVGSSPYGVVAGPGGTRAYVANRASDDVSIIDVARRTVVAAVPVGRHPCGIAVHPAGTRVYVANLPDNAVSVIDTAPSR